MRKFWIDCVLATALVFLIMWAISQITSLKVFNAFDSIGQALDDVELTDYVFQSLREDPAADTNIVVVNIGNLSRRGIAQQIQILSKYNPKIIGFDGFFDCWAGRDTINCPTLKDTLGNLMLSEAIREAGNIVLATKLVQSDALLDDPENENVADSLRRSDPIFRDHAFREGFANLDTDAAYQEDVKTCRAFYPTWIYDKKEVRAFSVELAMAYDPAKTKEFLDRENFREIIDYRGNIVDFFGTTNYPQVFYTLDVSDVLNENFAPDIIKGKIVLMGFLGSELGDPSWSDKFYTPLNKKLAGKANPDMFGVVVHANIVSMILHSDFVDEMANWQEHLLAFVICVLNVALFSLIKKRLALWYDGITKSLQLFQIILYSALMVAIFHKFKFKLEITLVLGAVALAGDVFEIYTDVFRAFYLKFRARRITKKADHVLSP